MFIFPLLSFFGFVTDVTLIVMDEFNPCLFFFF